MGEMGEITKEWEFNDRPVVTVGAWTLEDLKRRAEVAPRRRYRLCLHSSPEAGLHQMINVFLHETFIPPHRHPSGKDESYHILAGEMAVIFFDDAGRITDRVDLSATDPGKPIMIRVASGLWHMPVPLTEWVAFHEIFLGPFQREKDVESASWAPSDDSPEKQVEFRRMALESRFP